MIDYTTVKIKIQLKYEDFNKKLIIVTASSDCLWSEYAPASKPLNLTALSGFVQQVRMV